MQASPSPDVASSWKLDNELLRDARIQILVLRPEYKLLILRDLLDDGPQRFQDLLVSLEGIAPNTLSTRLKTLEARGLATSVIFKALARSN